MAERSRFDLMGKTALVTGGSRGLGLQIAEAICEFGGNVVLVARNAAELASAATSLEAAGGNVATIAADLQDLGGTSAKIHGVGDGAAVPADGARVLRCGGQPRFLRRRGAHGGRA